MYFCFSLVDITQILLGMSVKTQQPILKGNISVVRSSTVVKGTDREKIELIFQLRKVSAWKINIKNPDFYQQYKLISTGKCTTILATKHIISFSW